MQGSEGVPIGAGEDIIVGVTSCVVLGNIIYIVGENYKSINLYDYLFLLLPGPVDLLLLLPSPINAAGGRNFGTRPPFRKKKLFQ